jgi:hypothetical protein
MDEKANLVMVANQMDPMVERRMVQSKLWMGRKEWQQELANVRVFCSTLALGFLLECKMAHWMIWLESKESLRLDMAKVACLVPMKPMLENEKARWTLGMEWKD